MILTVASIVWSHRIPGNRSNWTPEKAAQYEQAAKDFHSIASAKPSEANREKLRQVEQRYQQLRQQLDTARGGRVWLSMVLQMLGVGLGLVGAIKLIVLQNQAEDERAQRG